MPDTPGSPGDPLEPDDESGEGDELESSQDPDGSASKQERPAEEIGEEARNYPAAELLSGMCTSVILERILDGDPLGVQERCAERVRERCQLLHFDHLYFRAMANIAHDGVRYRGEVPFPQWIYQRIDRSAEELIAEECEADAADAPIVEPWESHYGILSEMLGIPLSEVRPGVVRFNNLERAARQAFFSLCVEGVTFNRFIAEGNGPPSRARAMLRRAYRALSMPQASLPADDPDFLCKGWDDWDDEEDDA